MAVTQYIGARYVPLFADPLEWDNTRTYEPLTIVQHQGNSYTSRQAVPKGIDITNNTYWALTGNYNAQIEEYRKQVETFDQRITENTNKNTEQDSEISNIDSLSKTNEEDIAGLETTVNQHSNLIIQKMNGARPGVCVAIGDSITRGYGLENPASENWVAQLNANLGNIWDLHNYAVDGTGYVAGTETFLSQLQQASEDQSFENSAVNTVFIAGGINDYDQTWTAFTSAVSTTISYAVNTFTNADIIIVPFLCGSASLLKYRSNALSLKTGLLRYSYQYSNATRRIGVVDSANTWLIGMTQWADALHPNKGGQEQIASYMQQYVCYRSVMYPTYQYSAKDLPMNSGWRIHPQYEAESQIISNGGYNYISLTFENTAEVTNPAGGKYPRICDLPKWACPGGTFRIFRLFVSPPLRQNEMLAGIYNTTDSGHDENGSLNLYYVSENVAANNVGIRLTCTTPLI